MRKQWFALLVTVLTWLAAFLILLYVASDTGQAAAPDVVPEITEVSPASAPNDLDTPIVITGTNFEAGAIAQLDGTFLDDVTWISSTRLQAIVPWGLEAEVYDLTVTNPHGESATLAGAFTVTQGIGMWQTGGPYGGDVLDLILHPVTPTIIYALVHDTGLFVSYNGADHWELFHIEGWPTRLAIDAQSPDKMYFSGHDVLSTTNGGEHWNTVFEESGRISYVATHPISPGVVYAGVAMHPGNPILPGEEGGLYRSDDYGQTWVTRTNGLTATHVVAIAFHPDDPDRMIVGTRDGHIFLSTDGGKNWGWLAHPAWHIERLYFNPFVAHEAWATTSVPNDPAYPPFLLKSEDPDLQTWTPITVTENGGENVVWSLTFDPDGVTIWAASQGGGHTTMDSGATWSQVGVPSGFGEIRVFAVDPYEPSRVYAGDTAEGVARSDDGGNTWDPAIEGLAGVVPKALAASPHVLERVYAKTWGLGVLESENGGQSWHELGMGWWGPPRRGLIAVDPAVAERVYFGDMDEGAVRLQISENAGATWREVTETLPITWSGWKCDVNEIAPHPAITGQILVGTRLYEHLTPTPIGEGAIYISDDHGESWTYIHSAQPISKVIEFAYDAQDPNLVYAATEGTGLWKSTDSGWSWQEVTSWPGGPSDQPRVVSVVAHPSIPNAVYTIGIDETWPPQVEALFVSLNAGQSWESLDEGPHPSNDFLLYAPTWPATLYRGGGGGLYRSTDEGGTWEQVEGLPNDEVWSIDAAGDAERVVVYVGTSGGFVTEAQIGAITGSNDRLLGAGVYRMTTQLLKSVYLPLIARSTP